MSSSTTIDKGKGRALESSNTGSSSISSSNSPGVSNPADASASSSPARHRHNVRHGRGPLIRESDDDMDVGDGAAVGPQGDGLADDLDDETTRLLQSARDKQTESGLAFAASRPRSTVSPDASRRQTRNIDGSSQQIRHQSSRSRLGSREIIYYFLAISAFTMLLAFALLHLWIGHLVSEQSHNGGLQDMARRGAIVQGPLAVRIAHADDRSDAAFILELDLLVGVDVKKALGWERKEGSNWLRRLEARLAASVVHRLDSVTVGADRIIVRRPYVIENDLLGGSRRSGEASDLIQVDKIAPFEVPLSYARETIGVPIPRSSELKLRLPIILPNSADLASVAKRIWHDQSYDLEVEVGEVIISLKGIASSNILDMLVRKVKNRIVVPSVSLHISGIVPPLPIPSDPSSLVEIISYDIVEEKHSSTVAVAARAKLTNPLANASTTGQLPPFAWAMPFRVPVNVYLPTPPSTIPPRSHAASIQEANDPGILLANVEVLPFSFAAGEVTTEVLISGQLVQSGSRARPRSVSDTEPALSGALSRFVARYMEGKKNRILLRYNEEVRSSDDTPYPPPAVGAMLENVTVPFTLPGSNGKTQLFKNLKIEDMKIKLSGMYQPMSQALRYWYEDNDIDDDEPEGDLLCSGRVVGEIDLPPQFKKLEMALNVTGIWPDVFVYDGDLPAAQILKIRNQITFDSSILATSDLRIQGLSYPPNPIPPNAFARLHPSSLILASTIHYPANRTHNATTIISATFTDAPLFLLSGRGDVFRRFVGKIIFGGPGAKAKAGVRGVSSAQLTLGAWDSLGVEGLPVEGEFWVGSGGAGLAQ